MKPAKSEERVSETFPESPSYRQRIKNPKQKLQNRKTNIMYLFHVDLAKAIHIERQDEAKRRNVLAAKRPTSRLRLRTPWYRPETARTEPRVGVPTVAAG